MADEQKVKRSLWILAMVNVGIWAVALIVMVLMMRFCPGVKKLYPILAGGSAVGIALISVVSKSTQTRPPDREE